MPAIYEFNLHEALEVTKDATEHEIVASYRRLARIHHPDKNPNDSEATARFQRVSVSFLTFWKFSTSHTRTILFITTHRSKQPMKHSNIELFVDNMMPILNNLAAATPLTPLDSTMTMTSLAKIQPTTSNISLVEHLMPTFSYPPRDDFSFSGGGRGFSGFSFDDSHKAFEEMERTFVEQERLRREHYKQQSEEMKCRAAEQAAQKKFREDEKKREQETKKLEREKKEIEAKKRQEARWVNAGIENETEKRKMCYHDAFWNKVQQKRKFKCEECGQKRGLTTFECPHCGILACQLCNITQRKRFVVG